MTRLLLEGSRGDRDDRSIAYGLSRVIVCACWGSPEQAQSSGALRRTLVLEVKGEIRRPIRV